MSMGMSMSMAYGRHAYGRHALPVHHKKPYKNYNFQKWWHFNTLAGDSENGCINLVCSFQWCVWSNLSRAAVPWQSSFASCVMQYCTQCCIVCPVLWALVPVLGRNGSEGISERFNVRVNGESVLATVLIKMCSRNGSELGSVPSWITTICMRAQPSQWTGSSMVNLFLMLRILP